MASGKLKIVGGAFALTELLIVTAIITILAALLLPALAASEQQTWITQCNFNQQAGLVMVDGHVELLSGFQTGGETGRGGIWTIKEGAYSCLDH